MNHIYVIYNPDGTAYVGKTTNLKRRQKQHEYAMRVFNVDSKFTVYNEVSEDDDLDMAEFEAIQEVGENYTLTNANILGPGKTHCKRTTVTKDGVSKTFDTQTEAAAYIGVSINSISRACKMNYRCRGYKVEKS